MHTLDPKPFLRGHFHQAAFFIALGACAMLLARVHSGRVLLPTLVYVVSLVGMFGISALYHRRKWTSQQRVLMKRLDHSAIFVLIAGSGTPIFLLAMPPASGLPLMVTVWAAALVGILKTLVWTHSPKWVSSILYIGVGWLAMPYVHEIHTALGPWGFAFMLLGGLVYSIGAIVYAFKWPDPSPTYFGYHEIFHILVIMGATLHFMAIQPLIT